MTTAIALFAVTQATTDVDAQVEFFKGIDFIIDDGYEALEGVTARPFPSKRISLLTVLKDIPEEYYEARGVLKSNLIKTVAMRLPADPYMHVILNSWKDLKTTPGYPAPFNQIGSRGISMLVGDVESELSRLEKDFPGLHVRQRALTIKRKWGSTTSALVLDPEGTILELISIKEGSPYDPKNAKPPTITDMSWLHFMYNCLHFKETRPFYESFGMKRDHGVDFRPEVGFAPWGFEYFAKQMMDAFKFDMTTARDVAFLRQETDCSTMHLELIDGTEEGLRDPTSEPTWPQKGIARYCYRVPDYAGALKKQQARGTKIYVEDQRGCLEWKDTQWFFAGDSDGNLITLEQWFPCRQWGERD